jgi:hypothetical protein
MMRCKKNDLALEDRSYFGDTNPPFKRKTQISKMTWQAIVALSEHALTPPLAALGANVPKHVRSAALVSNALRL